MRNQLPGITITLVLLSLALSSFSQYYTNTDKNFLFEAGVGAGMMNCATDLGGPKGKGGSYYLNEINWGNSRTCASIYAGVLYKHFFGVRVEATIGSVHAYDSILKGIATKKAIGRYERNLSFQSSIKEFALIGEIHPFLLKTFEGELPVLSPYFLAGVAIFSFDPKARLNGELVRLQPLRTEGQGFPQYADREPYALTQMNLSFGAGIRYELRRFNLRAEIVNRRLYTDYLDDASTSYIDPLLFDTYLEPSLVNKARALYNRSFIVTGSTIKRGNVKNSDAYISINIKAGFKLVGGASEFHHKKSRTGCKKI